MNKVLLAVAVTVTIASIIYAWFLYMHKKEYDVSVKISDQEFYVRNGEIENCFTETNCLSAE